DLAWDAYGPSGSSPLARGVLDAEIAGIGSPEQRVVWQTARAGYGEERLAQDRSRIEAAVRSVEESLARSRWLAGSAYSLADIAMFAYLKYLPSLVPAVASEAAAPRAMAWLRSVEERPAVRRALARAHAQDAFAVAAPGPERIRWG
ncbi:MAG: glutathione S-transferase family protein, partial [Steroidobacteraceae bacterium]